MAAEEHLEEPADFGKISVNLIEEKEFPLDPYLFALSGNNVQQYCTMLSLMDFQNSKPEMFLITEEGIETPLSLVQVVEDFEIEPSLYQGEEAKETMQSDTPQQESPATTVHLQYNFMRKADEGVIQGKLSSDVSFSELQQGTSQQRQEYEFMSYMNSTLSSEPLQVHPSLKKPEGDLDSTNPKQERSHQPVARCCALAQPNECLTSQRSERSTIQNVAGLSSPANYSGKREQLKKHDIEKQSFHTEEKCQSCNKSGESSNEPVSFLVRPNARCSIIHQLAPAGESSSKDQTSSESRSIIGHQIILTNEWEKLFSQLSLGPKHLKDTVKKFFKCPDCGKGYAQKKSITRHLQKFHARGNQSLNTGQERSSSLGPGPCPYNKVYLEKKSLSCPGMVKGNTNNLSGHSQDYAPPSNVHGLSSASGSEPQTHNIKERRFQCSICGKAFTERSSLARHQFLHGAEKPFKCFFCDKSYTQKCHLKRHVQKAHIVTSYGTMKDAKGKTLQEDEDDFEPQAELHFTILEESEGGISQGKLWHCDIDAELQPDEGSSQPEPDDESVYSDRTRSSSPDLQEVLPDPGKSRVQSYPHQGPEQQVELHFTILEESEGGISEGKLCASEVSLDEPLEVDHHLPQNPNLDHRWNKPMHWGGKLSQPSDAEKMSPLVQKVLEGEMKGDVSQQESSDQQVELHFTVFDDPEEVSLSQGPEDYPTWESPFKPGMYPGDYSKGDWDTSIDSLSDVFDSSFQQQFYPGGRMYPCTECGRVFNRKSTLTRHWRTHTGEKPYSCLYCGRSFSLNLNLLTHQMTHTGEKPYKCPDCGQSFTRSTSVTRHQRSHQEGSPFKNDMWEETPGNLWEETFGCPVPYPYPMSLVEEKSYVCPDCGETFTHSGSLNRHLRMHRGERPYKCMMCGEGFCSMSKLYKHERIHMVDKPYHCEICGKSFAVKSTLTRHQMLHQAERPYMCSHCDKGYVQRSHLARHHHRVHPGIPFNPVKANSMPATILDSDNLVTYFWGDEETDTTSDPVPTQLIYSGADSEAGRGGYH